MKQNIIYLNN